MSENQLNLSQEKLVLKKKYLVVKFLSLKGCSTASEIDEDTDKWRVREGTVHERSERFKNRYWSVEGQRVGDQMTRPKKSWTHRDDQGSGAFHEGRVWSLGLLSAKTDILQITHYRFIIEILKLPKLSKKWVPHKLKMQNFIQQKECLKHTVHERSINKPWCK